jgi:hypothetical protein
MQASENWQTALLELPAMLERERGRRNNKQEAAAEGDGGAKTEGGIDEGTASHLVLLEGEESLILACMSVCTWAGRHAESLSLFEQMQAGVGEQVPEENGTGPHTLIPVVKRADDDGMVGASMASMGLRLSVAAYRAGVECCRQCGAWQRCLLILEQMQLHDVRWLGLGVARIGVRWVLNADSQLYMLPLCS